jgi:hypothetical protein
MCLTPSFGWARVLVRRDRRDACKGKTRNAEPRAEVVRVIESPSKSWGETGPRARTRRWSGLGRLRTTALVVAAALFGAALSAAGLVGLWDSEVGHRRAIEAKLVASKRHAETLATANTRLRAGLVDSRSLTAQLKRSSARLRAEAKTLLIANEKLIASAGSLHGSGGSLQRRALSVSRLAGTLGGDVIVVLRYFTNTSIGSLDPAYLKAQLDYLQPAVAGIRSAADALGAEAGDYTDAVDRFAAQAARYDSALKDLAGVKAR